MRWSYITILGFLLFSLSCNKEILLSKEVQEPAVYLAVTRAQETESINEDNTDYEDRVQNLALFVFDTNSGKKVSESFESPARETFIIGLTPGQRDFYFIANMPDIDLGSISDKEDIEEYMEELRKLDSELYLKATASKGFPMSRVYTNQTVTEGGTFYEPTPFKPVDGITEDKVKLHRVVAKLEIDLSALADQVSEVRYYHANRNFNLSSPTGVADTNPYYTDSGKDYVTLQGTAGKYLFYMPELKMPANVRWGASASSPINYFEVVFANSESYKIPIITNGGDITDYMAFVKTDEADFNILRNDHYLYKITKSNKKIEILYNVLPWNLVKKNMYMGYWFNVVIDDDGTVEVINTIADCMPHKVYLKAVNGAYFETEADVLKVFGYDERDADVNPLKLKEGYAEQFKINTSKVQTGVYLEIYYNQNPENPDAVPVKRITK